MNLGNEKFELEEDVDENIKPRIDKEKCWTPPENENDTIEWNISRSMQIFMQLKLVCQDKFQQIKMKFRCIFVSI